MVRITSCEWSHGAENMNDDTYGKLIAALLNPPTCPWSGAVTADQIKMILADADVVSDSIRDAVEAAS